MWLTVELLAALYLISLLWFWSLCRNTARRELNLPRPHEVPSNLIPFERGLEVHLRKGARAT